jgi:hypothetical protein
VPRFQEDSVSLTWAAAVIDSTHILPGAEHDIYKVGVRGLVFRYDGFEWVRSTVEKSSLKTVEKFKEENKRLTDEQRRQAKFKSVISHRHYIR